MHRRTKKLMRLILSQYSSCSGVSRTKPRLSLMSAFMQIPQR